MVIHDCNSVRVAVLPYEANSPLLIDADAVLALPIAFQFFQVVARRHLQIGQRSRPVQVFELPPGRAVQFRAELIRRTFPPESGLEASYRFVVEGTVPTNLAIVIERPDLYTIQCNGKPVRPAPGA